MNYMGIFVFPEHRLILGDRPFTPLCIEKDNKFLYMPLSPYCALVLSQCKTPFNTIGKMSSNTVRSIFNFSQATSSKDFIISRTDSFKEELDLIQRWKNNEILYHKIWGYVDDKTVRELVDNHVNQIENNVRQHGINLVMKNFPSRQNMENCPIEIMALAKRVELTGGKFNTMSGPDILLKSNGYYSNADINSTSIISSR
jgi:hypothetical protein